MMLLIAQWLSVIDQGFGVLRYITLRSIFAAITSLLICLLYGPLLINWLTSAKIGQSVRSDGPQSHLSKAGTPTMGGAMIIVAVALSTLLWSDLGVKQVWIVLFVTIGFGAIGWVDDYRKVMKGDSTGLRAKEKILWQMLVAGIAALVMYFSAGDAAETTLIVPFFKEFTPNLGWVFIPFAFLVIVGSSNAVNLTDGLDGLAILPSVLVAGGLGLIAYLAVTRFSQDISGYRTYADPVS